MTSTIRAGLFLGLLALASQAQAQEAPAEKRPYFSGLFTYTVADGDRTTDDGLGGYFGAGKAINDHWGWEIGAFGSHFDKESTARKYKEYGGELSALFFYTRTATFAPYFSLTGGAVRTQISGNSLTATDPYGAAGLGFFKYFTLAGHDLAFRADVRYRHIFTGGDSNAIGLNSDLNEPQVRFGLTLPLGPKPVVAAPPPPPAKPTACADADGDGVCDTADLCPETPKGTAVDAKGCPKVVAAAETPDRKFEDVRFAFDKTDLTDYATATLDNAATTINDLATKFPKLQVDVAGHTDWVGTDGYNQGLSERRANTVKTYLVRKGVEAGRINTYAYGESKPIATNETAEGRAQNRRVEVRTRGE